jgi:hypothetical protein
VERAANLKSVTFNVTGAPPTASGISDHAKYAELVRSRGLLGPAEPLSRIAMPALAPPLSWVPGIPPLPDEVTSVCNMTVPPEFARVIFESENGTFGSALRITPMSVGSNDVPKSQKASAVMVSALMLDAMPAAAASSVIMLCAFIFDFPAFGFFFFVCFKKVYTANIRITR